MKLVLRSGGDTIRMLSRHVEPLRTVVKEEHLSEQVSLMSGSSGDKNRGFTYSVTVELGAIENLNGIQRTISCHSCNVMIF